MTHGKFLKNHSFSWGLTARNSSTTASASRRFPSSTSGVARKISALCSCCGSLISRASSSARSEFACAPGRSPWAASAELDAIRTEETR